MRPVGGHNFFSESPLADLRVNAWIPWSKRMVRTMRDSTEDRIFIMDSSYSLSALSFIHCGYKVIIGQLTDFRASLNVELRQLRIEGSGPKSRVLHMKGEN